MVKGTPLITTTASATSAATSPEPLEPTGCGLKLAAGLVEDPVGEGVAEAEGWVFLPRLCGIFAAL